MAGGLDVVWKREVWWKGLKDRGSIDGNSTQLWLRQELKKGRDFSDLHFEMMNRGNLLNTFCYKTARQGPVSEEMSNAFTPEESLWKASVLSVVRLG